MSSALEEWQEVVRARQVQMDAAYERLRRTSTDFWDRRAQRFRAIGLRLNEDDLGLRLLRRFTNSESSVLDVGAGAGRYARAIAPHVRRVVAVEPNAALVEHLRSDASADGLTNVDMVEARWEDAVVEAADLVLCAHVLYPHADVEPFIRKLDEHNRGVCLILSMAAWQEPPLMLDLWQRFHGEPRRGQPNARHVFNVLYEMGIPANVEFAPLRTAATQWSFESLDEAVAVCREHLILPAEPDTDRELTAALRDGLKPVAGGRLLIENAPRVVAGLWWQADGPRLA
jgi:SAM-dependent methyltransferase